MGVDGARVAHGFEQLLDFRFRDKWNDGRDAHAHGNARLRQGADGAQPPRRGGRARLQRARNGGIEGGDSDGHGRQALGRHGCQNVDIALDQRRFRDQRHGMLALAQHFQHAPRQLPFAFARLIRIGIDAKGDRFRHIRRLGQFLPQQFGRVHFGVDAAFEVQARGQSQIAVRGTGKAINAAMFAASVRVQGHIEGQIGRGIARKDAACLLVANLRLPARSSLLSGGVLQAARAPAIIKSGARMRLVAPLQVRHGTAPLVGFQRLRRQHGLPGEAVIVLWNDCFHERPH